MSSANALKDVRDPPTGQGSTHACPPKTTNDDASTHAARNFSAVSAVQPSSKKCFTAAALHGE